MCDVVVRELRAGDEETLRILAVEAADFGDEDVAGGLTPPTKKAASALLTDPAACLWGAFANGEVIGFVLAYVLRRRHGPEKQLFLYEIGVRRKWRRRGVGRKLMRHLEDDCRAAGITAGFLPVDERNVRAIAFYESVGWQRLAEPNVLFRFPADPTD